MRDNRHEYMHSNNNLSVLSIPIRLSQKSLVTCLQLQVLTISTLMEPVQLKLFYLKVHKLKTKKSRETKHRAVLFSFFSFLLLGGEEGTHICFGLQTYTSSAELSFKLDQLMEISTQYSASIHILKRTERKASVSSLHLIVQNSVQMGTSLLEK